jgi:hypothetical protein
LIFGGRDSVVNKFLLGVFDCIVYMNNPIPGGVVHTFVNIWKTPPKPGRAPSILLLLGKKPNSRERSMQKTSQI